MNAMRKDGSLGIRNGMNEGVMVQQFSRRCSHWGKHERRDGTTLGNLTSASDGNVFRILAVSVELPATATLFRSSILPACFTQTIITPVWI